MSPEVNLKQNAGTSKTVQDMPPTRLNNFGENYIGFQGSCLKQRPQNSAGSCGFVWLCLVSAQPFVCFLYGSVWFCLASMQFYCLLFDFNTVLLGNGGKHLKNIRKYSKKQENIGKYMKLYGFYKFFIQFFLVILAVFSKPVFLTVSPNIIF